jgi:hypothetical protein
MDLIPHMRTHLFGTPDRFVLFQELCYQGAGHAADEFWSGGVC